MQIAPTKPLWTETDTVSLAEVPSSSVSMLGRSSCGYPLKTVKPLTSVVEQFDRIILNSLDNIRVIRVFRPDHFATLRPAQLVAVHGRSFEWLDIRTETVAQLRDPVTLERAWVSLAAITVPAQPEWAPTHPAVREGRSPTLSFSSVASFVGKTQLLAPVRTILSEVDCRSMQAT